MEAKQQGSSKKLRASFTLLNLWRKGQYQQAVDFYLKKPPIITQAIEEGYIYDTRITEWVDLYKKLPEEFGGDELINPQTQIKLEVPYNDMCDLVAVYDILDEPILWENKSGESKDSADYSLDFQIPLYFLIADLSGKTVDRAIINHYNQATDTLDRTLVWKTTQETERGKNLLDSLVPEIFEYFNKQGILTINKV